MSLSVIIPSRAQPRQAEFLRRAVNSICAQTVYSAMKITILVCIDRGKILSPELCDELAVLPVNSNAASQAAALNAGLRRANTELVAILEDDDVWHPKFLENAKNALSFGGFVSSTQLEVDDEKQVIRINDFPTPSGWLFPFSTLRAVGEFNETYRWHLDNEWLGRLDETEISRVHLVEATAPIDLDVMKQVRPWLANVIELGGPGGVARHDSPYPLITRLVHPGSGLKKIEQNKEFKTKSEKEIERLRARFGRTPW